MTSMETSVINVPKPEETYGRAKSLRAESMRYCQNQNQNTAPRKRVLQNRLTRCPSGRLLFPSWHFSLQFCWFFAVSVRCRGQVESECGLRWSVHGHTRRRCGRACARVRKSLFWLSE